MINGALEAVYEYPERYSEDQLIIRPFPQFETGEKKLADLWDEYRHRMISLAGVAIFVFGNKMGEAGEVASAGGVKREFEIAIKEGLIPIPVGATEYVARELYAMIEADPKHYYGEVDWIFPAVKELAEAEATADTLVSKMTDIIKKLNR